LAHKARPEARGREGRPALLYAAERRKPEMVKLLLAAGAPVNDVDFKGESALLAATMYGGFPSPEQAEIVDLLLAAGAKADMRLPDGRSALLIAASLGETKVVRALLAHGARAGDRDPAGKSAWVHASGNLTRGTQLALEEAGIKPTPAERQGTRLPRDAWFTGDPDERGRWRGMDYGGLWLKALITPRGAGKAEAELILRDQSRLDADKKDNAVAARWRVPLAAGEYLLRDEMAVLPLTEDKMVIFVPVVTGVPDDYHAARALLFTVDRRRPAFDVLWQSPACAPECAQKDVQIVRRDHATWVVVATNEARTWLRWDGKALTPAPPPAWSLAGAIDVRARDWNDDPVVNARYRVTSKGGEEREGRVGDDGLAHVAMSTPGPYEIAWPEFHGGQPF
jgi:hypothetical protein